MGNDSCRKRIDRERQTTQSQHANSSPTNSDEVLLEILKTGRLFENHLLCDSPEHKDLRRRNVCETQAAFTRQHVNYTTIWNPPSCREISL